ncbi:MAG: hypothetical protein P8X90_21220, partial [Desulfobacterales bacterium]
MKVTPSLEKFRDMARQGNLIPVYRDFLADTETPVSAYLKLRDDSYSYLLESADGGKRWGRYSFIGCRPFIRTVSRNGDMMIRQGDRMAVLKDAGNPLAVLRELSANFKPVAADDLPPFQGGLVGYFNYDLVRKWERLPGAKSGERDLPESIFIACRDLIVFDHFSHMIKVVVFAYLPEDADVERIYRRACREAEQIVMKLKAPLSGGSEVAAFSTTDLESNFQRKDFEAAVSKAKEYIAAGDVIQVVLSQKFSAQ